MYSPKSISEDRSKTSGVHRSRASGRLLFGGVTRSQDTPLYIPQMTRAAEQSRTLP